MDFLIDSRVHLNFSSVCRKPKSKSRENATVSAAILCPAICDIDVIYKACMCAKRIRYIKRETFFCSSLLKNELTWLRPD